MMKDERIELLDAQTKIALVAVDCTQAAVQLARGHLAGPTAATYLAEALAGVALLGAETSQVEETVTLRLDCPGPLEGFLVEATAAGTLRGYTKKKILNDFDGLGVPKDTAVLGETGTFEILRSIPGSILSSGVVATAWRKHAIAHGLDAYFDQSLQRRVRTAVVAAAGDDGVPLFARGLLVECAPDGDAAAFDQVAERFHTGAAAKALATGVAAPRTLAKKLALAQADVRRTTPLAFACRCSAERASAMLAAVPESERAALPPRLDVTCHMCGRTWTVSVPQSPE